MCCDREVWDSPHEDAFFVLSLEFSIFIYHLLNGSKISDVHLALVDSEVIRLEISVNVACLVNLYQSFQHFGSDICYNRVDVLAIGNSFVNMFLQGLLKVLYYEVPSTILLSVIEIIGEASELFIELLEVYALLENTGVTSAVGIELDSTLLLRIHLQKLAHGPLAT